MCISVLSTAHPDYAFVLISNRDEFVHRPTLRADWWDAPNQQVLAGRDLQREERGTWLGITKQGRIAILTNFREEGVNENGQKSRGAMVNSYLTVPPNIEESEDEFAQRLLNDVGIHDVGGFTLIFGKLQPSKTHDNGTNATSRVQMYADHLSTEQSTAQDLAGLSIISNRTESTDGLRRIATTSGETHGLSNSHYGDNTWPKVVNGEKKLKQLISDDIANSSSRSEFVENLFGILCEDSLPKRQDNENWDEYVRHMRNSIMIPALKGKTAKESSETQANSDRSLAPGNAKLTPGAGAYGTTKQTVILVDKKGKGIFVERTLYDDEGVPLPDQERDRRIEFQIEGWE